MDRLNITCPFRAKYFFGSNNYPRRCHRAELNKAFSLKMNSYNWVMHYIKQKKLLTD